MKKSLLTTLIALGSLSSYNAMAADCVVELQFEGAVLGQNTFIGNTCIDAVRDCKRTQKAYERKYSFADGELSCVRLGDIGPGPGPGNGGGHNGGGHTGGGHNGGNNGGYNGGGHNGGGHNGGGHTGGNNGGYNGGYDPNYSNLQALNDLEDMENDNSQARDVYNVILDFVDQRMLGLREGVDLYAQILSANGGANSTDASKAVLIMLVNEAAASQIAPAILGDAYVRMVNAENDDDQAKENLRIVLNQAQINGVDPVLAIDTFAALLEASGPNATDEVRRVFLEFIVIRRVSIDKAIRDYTVIANLENSADDAMSNYKLVLAAAERPSVRYRDALDAMIQLLQRHGANGTSTVQSKFRDIFRL